MENPYWPDTIFNTGDTLFANINFTYNDSRRFKCAATNDVSERESRWITVEMKKGPDSVRITTKPPRGRQHEPFEMECSATCNNGCLSYSWFHERKLIHNGERLHFSTLLRTDNGVYTCTVSDYFGTTSISYNLNVQYGPVNVSIQYTSEGNNLIEKQGYVKLTCHADCNPSCSYMFYHNDKRKQNRCPGEIYKTKENSGRYSCSAKNYVADTPTNSSNYVDIYIQYKPRLTVPNFPQITAPGSLKLNFNVDSFPASNVTIFHEEEKLEFFSNFTGNKTYEINISTCLNGGKYRIVAENIVGKQSTSKTLTVKCAPIILTSSNTTNKGFEIGDALNLTVTFMAKPIPNVSWTFFTKEGDVNKSVPKNTTATGKEFTSIVVSNMSVHDFGTYQLTLNNKFGRNETEFNIQGVPQPPTELTVDCSNTALIQWKSGFDGGSDQRFVIEYTTNVSSSWLFYNPHPVTSDNASYVFTEINFLQPYVPYFFGIVAKNRFGNRSSDTIANCTVQNMENEGFQDNEVVMVVIGGGVGGGVLLLLAIAVLFVVIRVKRKQRIKKRPENSGKNSDAADGMVENILYISADEATNSLVSPSNPSGSRDALETKRGNDVYSVVMKTRKPESDTPVYAEVQKSQTAASESQNQGRPPIKKKPTKSRKRSGKNVKEDGLVYVELDLKMAPSSSDGNPIIHGAEDRVEYGNIDFTRPAKPVKE
ncbi:carcinoembryonic antigen-related cell adhesion molecule 5-like [Ostrea edulis]|uniref:carcinoembryonic antigen-related cell adhesion molecule 5-like n=1 Tax=Ostrea edulis TaxID=37623 RepID=UPI0024AFAE70|nr:carcinoembryonic antigen-related cell adhesion molecule 5-like [Ostrea edulis]